MCDNFNTEFPMSKSDTILITGSKGQLGSDLVKELAGEYQVFAVTREDFDVSDTDKTLEYVREKQPGIIIHPAAFKDVDGCEKQREKAASVNAIGTRNLAAAAAEVDAVLIYISTDYVFGGTKQTPYTENDLPDPVNFYGWSKLWGEQLVKEHLKRFFIIRTAWLYGDNGDNFVKSMLRLADERDELKIVRDKFSTPSHTVDLVRQISKLIDTQYYGTYHCTAQGSCSWYEYALKIFEYAGKQVKTVPIGIDEFQFYAKRPLNTVLENSRLKSRGLDIMPRWEESLEGYVEKFSASGI